MAILQDLFDPSHSVHSLSSQLKGETLLAAIHKHLQDNPDQRAPFAQSVEAVQTAAVKAATDTIK